MRDYHFTDGEILLVNKPLHWTSFDVVNKIKYALKPLKLKVGHAGTLDPLASGLLIVCTGKKTKQIESLQATLKTYTGTLVLGATTPSFDLETEIDHTYNYEHITEQEVNNACSSFIGEIEQTPPIYSAVKQNGERLYEKARRGEEVNIRKRFVEVFEFNITRISLPEIDFEVKCSKGTYIRSLAHDFGKKLNSGAYLAKLCRTQSGNFCLNDALEISELIDEISSLKQDSKLS